MASKTKARINNKATAGEKPAQTKDVTPGQVLPATQVQQARRSPTSLTASGVLQLQRAVGNQAVSRVLLQTLGRDTNSKPSESGDSSGSDRLLQRKLVRGKLNIVGEEHPESEKRLEQEKQFVREEKYGSYWRENTFSINVAGKKKFGDPPQERIISDTFVMNSARLGLMTAAEKGRLGRAGAMEDMKTLEREHKEIGYELVKLEGERKQPQLKELAEQLGEEIKFAGEEMRSENRDASEVTKSMQEIHKLLEKIVQVLGRKNPLGDEGILSKGFDANIFDRSMEMYLAATQSPEVGVWKVGDLHIKDMENELLEDDGEIKADERITITKQEEFNKEYHKWNQAKGMKDVMDVFGAFEIKK